MPGKSIWILQAADKCMRQIANYELSFIYNLVGKNGWHMLISNFTTVLNPPTFCSANKARGAWGGTAHMGYQAGTCEVCRLQDEAWLWSVAEELLCACVIKACTRIYTVRKAG